MKIMGKVKCVYCGQLIAIVEQIDTGTEYKYKVVNLDNRFIDKWGSARNVCKSCVK